LLPTGGTCYVHLLIFLLRQFKEGEFGKYIEGGDEDMKMNEMQKYKAKIMERKKMDKNNVTCMSVTIDGVWIGNLIN
jgi:hypothetical protein